MYEYRFPVGDWSDDGHGKCVWFVLSGQKPIEDVREAHFKCKKVFGFDPGEMCADYEESDLTDKIKKKLIKVLGNTLGYNQERLEFLDGPEDLLRIWMDMLNHVDPELNLLLVVDPVPTINFYGYDEKNRHLETPGYGLFVV